MTNTHAHKIAAAVQEVAANDLQANVPHAASQEEAETWACAADAIRSLDIDAIVASVPKEAEAPVLTDEKLIAKLSTGIDCWMEIEPEDRGDILTTVRALLRHQPSGAEVEPDREWMLDLAIIAQCGEPSVERSAKLIMDWYQGVESQPSTEAPALDCIEYAPTGELASADVLVNGERVKLVREAAQPSPPQQESAIEQEKQR